MPTALLVEDDPQSLRALDTWIRGRAMTTRLASTLSEAREGLSRGPVDLAIVDLILPDGSGFDLADEIDLSTRLIFVSGETSPPKTGAPRDSDFLPKPLNLERLSELIAGAEKDAQEGKPRFGSFIGSSKPMKELYEELSRISVVDATVFLCGETGVGKELAARQVHHLSRRSRKHFEAINCGALAPTLVESELFGHERGSFTGAHKRHHGVFERAQGGTVFLDEITEMPMELQVKLLRVLETSLLRRVGGSEDIPVDFRLVVATNRNPAHAVAEGRLREDLFYRLYVLPVVLPPLRERGADIIELAEGFLREWSDLHGERKELAPEARQRLLEHDWPGNVRELRNTMYRAYHVSKRRIGADAIRLMPRPRNAESALSTGASNKTSYPVGLSLREVERRHLLATLEDCGGDKKKTAEVLGISLKTVYNKLKAYGHSGRNGDEE